MRACRPRRSDPRLFAAIDPVCEHGARVQRDRSEGQAQLFGAFDEAAHDGAGTDGDASAMRLPEAPSWSDAEQLAFEKETLGLYLSGHPVDRYTAALKQLGAKTIGELATSPVTAPSDNGWGPKGPKPIEPETSLGGIIATVRPLKTRKGDRMAVFTLEDSQGSVEVVVFPEAFQRSATMIEIGTLVLVRGRVERDEETVRMLAAEVAPLDIGPRAPGPRGVDSSPAAGGPFDPRGAGRDFRPAPRRSPRFVRSRGG